MTPQEPFQYIIMPARLPKGADFANVHNTVFSFWKSTWTKAFLASGDPDTHWQEQFNNYDLVTAVLVGRDVVGCHLYTFHNLKSLAALHGDYLRYLPQESLNILDNSNINFVMSMEYLCIDPKWRRTTAGVALSDVVTGLGFILAEKWGCQHCVGTIIKGTKVDLIGKRFGGKVVNSSIKKYGYDLCLMVIDLADKRKHPDDDISRLIDSLWKSREDYVEKGNRNTLVKAS